MKRKLKPPPERGPLTHDVDFLERLNANIWRENGMVTQQRGRRALKSVMTYKEARRLTEEEWRAIWRIVDDFNLAVTVYNTNYGFQFGFYIYEGPQVSGTKSRLVLKIHWDHLLIDPDGAYDDICREIWEHVRPFFDTQRNKEKLKVFGLKSIGKMTDYNY